MVGSYLNQLSMTATLTLTGYAGTAAKGPDSYMVNDTDLEWLRWIFDALDGKETSWLSRRQTSGGE